MIWLAWLPAASSTLTQPPTSLSPGRRPGHRVGGLPAGYRAVKDGADDLAGSGADQRTCHGVAGIVHAGVHARIGHTACQELKGDGQPRIVAADRGSEGERGGRVPGRE